jgi:hypothetical protein
MLTIYGQGHRLCDGFARRSFLQAGGLSLFTGQFLSLADIFRSEAAAANVPRDSSPLINPRTGRHKSVICVFLGGGPPHQDMWDLKPDAPSEIRGEFSPIQTNVPGIHIGETFHRLAKLQDKATLIRSVVGNHGDHAAFQCYTGYRPQDLAVVGGRPSIGSVASKVQGPVEPSVPPFVGLSPKTSHAPWGSTGDPGFLGPTYSAFKPDGPTLDNMKMRDLTLEKLGDRKKLLASFDRLKSEVDYGGQLASQDAKTAQAFDVLTGSKLLKALDLSKEDPRIRARYGTGQPFNYTYDGAPTNNELFLVARRLVEAGVRVVTMTFGRWDSHGDNFTLVRDHGGKLDQAMSALVEDLDARGMLDDVTIIAWGEFGRTPRINKEKGRDHWPQLNSAWIAGGGLNHGQVIGASNRLGEYATERPVHVQEVVATLYHSLGLPPNATTVMDPAGRPQYLTEMNPIRELIG